jgi:ribosomal-protein-alanine N-acetyltransferase
MRSFEPFPALETPRLVLRRILPSDAGAFHRLRSDPEVTRYRGRPPLTRAEAEQRLVELDADLGANALVMWGMALRDSHDLIGTCLLFHWDKEHMHAEVGYELTPALWGRGLVPEAVRAILAFGFDAMDLHRVEANVDPDNARSIRVLEKLGFVREATLRENWRFGARFTSSAIFGLLRREFVS